MKLLSKGWTFLDGKKAYLVAILFVVLAGLKSEGYVTPELYELVVAVLGGLGLAAVRHGISKS